MDERPDSRSSRRRFIIRGLCAGAAAGTAGVALLQRRRRRGASVFRNPAYGARSDGAKHWLTSQDRRGVVTVYEMDALAAAFWALVPSAEEFAYKGLRVTVESLIERMAERHGTPDAAWVRDATRFAAEAIASGVLLTEGQTVFISHTPEFAPKESPA